MATIQNTGQTLIDVVDPTTSDTSYTYEENAYPISQGTFWFNTANDTLFFCCENNGAEALWKQFSLS